MKVVYHAGAYRDFYLAINYYDSISTKLSDEFFDEVQSAVNEILKQPTRFRLMDSRLRRFNLKCFPFHILYETRLGYVRIIVIRHNKRNPKFGTRRF